MRVNKETLKELIILQAEKGILLEGDILNHIKTKDPELLDYIAKAKTLDKEQRSRRIRLSQEIQTQKKKAEKAVVELKAARESLEDVNQSLGRAKQKADDARDTAEKELEVEKKKKEFDLVDFILRRSMQLTIGVLTAFIVTYCATIILGRPNETLSNLVSSLVMLVIGQALGMFTHRLGMKDQETQDTVTDTNQEIGKIQECMDCNKNETKWEE